MMPRESMPTWRVRGRIRATVRCCCSPTSMNHRGHGGPLRTASNDDGSAGRPVLSSARFVSTTFALPAHSASRSRGSTHTSPIPSDRARRVPRRSVSRRSGCGVTRSHRRTNGMLQRFGHLGLFTLNRGLWFSPRKGRQWPSCVNHRQLNSHKYLHTTLAGC